VIKSNLIYDLNKSTRRFRCKQCGNDLFNEHMPYQGEHRVETFYVCTVCQEKYSVETLARLNVHHKRIAQKEQPVVREKIRSKARHG